MKLIVEKKRKIITIAVLFIVSLAALITSKYNPGFANWYTSNVYPLLVNTIGRLVGFLPFLLFEFMIYALVIAFAVSIIRTILKVKHDKKARPFLLYIFNICLAASIIFFSYTFGCGINYSADLFSDKENLTLNSYSTDALATVCSMLADRTNALSDSVFRNSSGDMVISNDERYEAVTSMELLSETYSSLNGYYPLPKKMINSGLMSYQGISGIYIPFTIEANYNNDMPDYNKPFTACHELSHLRGFMSEDEANYIAFLACINSESSDFNYSGYITGLSYCLSALRRADIDKYEEITASLDASVKHDLSVNSDFWNSYDGVISDMQSKVNDSYLKAHGDSDGVNSYGRMVDLIVSNYSLLD
ncbi:MAG: DUF3810 domain-containing protein [Suipraeoptans sp.]